MSGRNSPTGAAADMTPLPASPVTLAEFLGDNPAGDRVQIRRISAINCAHLDAGQPPPGRTTALRLALDSARAERRHRRARQFAAAAAGLPTAGSTEALFGRRDAVLLMLVAAGLSYHAIAALDRTDIEFDEEASLWIGGGHRLRLTADSPAGFRPAEVWPRWDTVLRFADRYPSTTLVLDHLRGNTFPDVTVVAGAGVPGGGTDRSVGTPAVPRRCTPQGCCAAPQSRSAEATRPHQ
ncbi:hypothetical protein QMK17_24190 [Rhodococcus sp. G-MC3]|uniref:hypothetical protein n=1 Tax=Rhodococcus sp. G-MC3 TaxID=3046209 RepID=UPI0024BA2973|nr:hypothetical protein [Rhodococcus sp. G-MC3]MDJ0396410.1 hypothetical protein [Rhodococcus sp. G-MC3]